MSMTRRLDFNDVHSDVESIAPIIPARECTTPQKSFSIPFCVSVLQLCTFNTFLEEVCYLTSIMYVVGFILYSRLW